MADWEGFLFMQKTGIVLIHVSIHEEAPWGASSVDTLTDSFSQKANPVLREETHFPATPESEAPGFP